MVNLNRAVHGTFGEALADEKGLCVVGVFIQVPHIDLFTATYLWSIYGLPDYY